MERAEALFTCRAGVARKVAEDSCDLGLQAPPAPSFAQATLNLRRFTSGHRPAPIPGNDSADPPEVPRTLPIAVEPHSDIVSNALQRKGVWEISEVEAVLTALERSYATSAPRRPVLIDIGANLGVYTVVAAALGYDVIAFEAMPRNVAAIRQTLCWNPELRERVTLFPYGLGAAERSCAVLSDGSNVGDGHLVCSEPAARVYRHMVARAAAHSVRLGDYLEGVQADVVKLDVEGYEPQVVAGAGDVLDRVQFALSEVSSDMAKKAHGSFRAVVRAYLQTWHEHGFDVRFCEPGFGCLMGPTWGVEDAAREAEARGLSNALFVRRFVATPVDPDSDEHLEPEGDGGAPAGA